MAGKKQKLLQKADAFARDKKLKKAISLYKQVIAEDASDVRTRLRLSELLYQAGRMDEALEVLQFVGDYYHEHGFLLKSVAVYKKMLEVAPARMELHGTLAELYFQLGMAPDAIRQFKAHIRALLKQGKVRESLFVIRSMLELDASNVLDRLRLAENLSRHEMIDEAAKEYRRVLGLLEKNDRVEDWGPVALRYLHHNPEDEPVRRRVVEYLLREGDYHRALQHLHVCLEREPRDTQLLDMAANCFEMLGQPEKAIVVLKSLVSILRQTGMDNDAQDAFVRILQLDPKDDQALAALQIDAPDLEEIPEVVELEWEMPDSGVEPPEPSHTEFAETVYEEEPPAFAGEWEDEKTLIEPISEDLLRELMLDDDEEPMSLAIDVLRIKRALDNGEPLTVVELEDCGVTLTPNDKEELEFFITSGLKEEALAILNELHSRLS
jgi:tetratricopeptide (TPR) repeat protein